MKIDPTLKAICKKHGLNPETDLWDCVEWWGTKRPDGYGVHKANRKQTRAHRFVWEECFGPLGENLVLHHRCNNKLCVNPSHLEPMTRATHNHLHGREITHCPKGHPYNRANTYWRVDTKRGWVTRKCRVCNNESMRKKRAL